MRSLLVLAFAVAPAFSQSPVVRLINTSHPGKDFQIGDRFEVAIFGAPDQPVSVRTEVAGRRDWSPVIGRTDANGRWSVAGRFDKSDYGGRRELWTLGGKLAAPVVEFSVRPPCLPGRQELISVSGMSSAASCETAEGQQSFVTPSGTDPLRTPDGRTIPPGIPRNQTKEEYRADQMQWLMAGGANEGTAQQLGDEAAALIRKIIGVNALTADETANVLRILRSAFERPERIPQAALAPTETLLLLRSLADSTGDPALKAQIAETIRVLQVI